MKDKGFIFKALLFATTALTLASLTVNAVEAYRMRDPDYARMLEDRRHYEEVVSKKGLKLHPASHWRVLDESGVKERRDGNE